MTTIANSNAATQAEIRALTIGQRVNAKDHGVLEGTGNETANDIALIAMRDFMLTSPETWYNVYFEPGDYVYGETGRRWVWGLYRLTIDAYGCSFSNTEGTNGVALRFANDPFNNDPDEDYVPPHVWTPGDLFGTAVSGQNSITTTTAGDAANYAAGEVVFLAGWDQQNGTGYPPNFRYFEWLTVATVDGGTGIITFEEVLRNSYGPDWREYSGSTGMGNNNLGLQRIYPVEGTNKAWPEFIHIKGASFPQTGATPPPHTPIYLQGRMVILEDVTTQQYAPHMSDQVVMIRCTYNASSEYDKLVNSIYAYDCTFKDALGSGTSINLAVFEGCTFLQGTSSVAKRTIYRNCEFYVDDTLANLYASSQAWPQDSLTFTGCTFHCTGDQSYAISDGGTLRTFTVAAIATNDIKITTADNVMKRFMEGQTITETTTGNTGIITRVYWDGTYVCLEGTWGTPSVSEVYEYFMINNLVDGGGNVILGDNTTRLFYEPARVTFPRAGSKMFPSGDTSPSVGAGYPTYTTHSGTLTINDFDDGIAGQTIFVKSTGVVAFDVSGNLNGGTTKIRTQDGDTTQWFTADGTDWHLVNFMDNSVDNSQSVIPTGMTQYDGAGDWAQFPANLGTDGNKITVSFLFSSKLDSGSGQQIIEQSGTKLTIKKRPTTNLINFHLRNAAGTVLVDVDSTVGVSASDGIVHILCAATTDGGGNIVIKIDGVDRTGTPGTDTSGDIDYTISPYCGVMGTATGGSLCTGCISELYINTAEYTADATKFATGNEGISLGADGSTPTGTQPTWYIPDVGDGTNAGSAGGSLTSNGDPQAGCV